MYEHRARLERSLQKEKTDHKNTKQGWYQTGSTPAKAAGQSAKGSQTMPVFILEMHLGRTYVNNVSLSGYVSRSSSITRVSV